MYQMNQKAPVLVKFKGYENYINIRTISRQHKSPQSFDLPRPSFTDLEAPGISLSGTGTLLQTFT